MPFLSNGPSARMLKAAIAAMVAALLADSIP